MSTIVINGNKFDPSSPVTNSLGLNAANASESKYILIQTTGSPLRKEQKKELGGKGVEIHEYVSGNTYLCAYGPEDLGVLRDLPYIQYANIYQPLFVVQPSLRTAPTSMRDEAAVLNLGSASGCRNLHTADVIFHQDIRISSTLKKDIAVAAHVDPETLKENGDTIRLSIQEQYLNAVANIDAVRCIQEVPPATLCNDIANKIMNGNVIIQNIEYKGEGEVIAVADTGFDIGDPQTALPAFSGRVRQLYPLGRPASGRADDPNGHGTHVCGSALGDADSVYGKVTGIAPKAELVMQSLLDNNGGLGGIPPDLGDLFRVPYYDHDARIHTNSWGRRPLYPGYQNPYDGSSRSIDKFVWEHPEMVICFAAGNDGIDGNGNGIVDYQSLGSQAAAKNCITVGATESIRRDIEWDPPPWRPQAQSFTYGEFFPRDYPQRPIYNDHMADNSEGMAAFSSRGPTKEKRIKPDIVAPGTSILSTLSQRATATTYYGKSRDPHLTFDSGTSMATPLVAGCCAVIREILVKNHVVNPSSALIKALIINGAVDISGQYNPSEAGYAPNGNSGYGRVDLANSAIIPGTNSANEGCGDAGPLDDEDEFELKVKVPEKLQQSPGSEARRRYTSPTLKITLVYSDYPAEELQNDLNLIVISSEGSERHGNMGTSSFSPGSMDGFDRSNNVEQVVWTGIPSGEATIKIKAFRVTKEKQPFAYAWRLF
ncbi:hypothetical protein IFM46972_07712 [Aspergillus udagawae]|uniref:oryzin n=1 Tax=Aspergillus udagawae TaxID=91492 RepID=A0A8H3P7R0_9EURO|nr:hypothetical protein IFM46972_07712 [Aspergillus udagawae]